MAGERPTLAAVLARYPGAQTFTFGDGETLCAQLLGLVRSGRKTATCCALRDVEAGREPLAEPGRRDVALAWDGTPALVIETVAVQRCRFRDVTAEFALAEGEDDTLEDWRVSHEAYFARNGGFSPDMWLVCERFTLVEAF